jgi:uncharacterized protein YndB with AHSA1/START domain
MSDTDRIVKRIVLGAPRSRVWRALTSVDEFNAWFGVKLEGVFAEGKKVRGNITHPQYSHLVMEIEIARVDPERHFSYRWHPYAIDPNVDYSNETPTLVSFDLEDADGGTMLTIVESGFDQVPLARRKKALEMNGDGWAQQLESIRKHVAA